MVVLHAAGSMEEAFKATFCERTQQPDLELHVQVVLGDGQDADGGLRLAQLVVDADERLDRGLGRGRKLQLLVVEGLRERVALLRERAQGPAHEPLRISPGTDLVCPSSG